MAKKISRRELERRARQRADSHGAQRKRDRAEKQTLAELLDTQSGEVFRFEKDEDDDE